MLAGVGGGVVGASDLWRQALPQPAARGRKDLATVMSVCPRGSLEGSILAVGKEV